MPRKLIDPPDILTIHRLFAAGLSIVDIARETRRSRNTVSTHLQGNYPYPRDLRRRIASILSHTSRTMTPHRPAPDGWITLYQAIDLMPHRPTYGRAYVYVRSGLLKAEVKNGITCTKPAWVKRFIREHCKLPKRGIGCFKSEAWILLGREPDPAFWKSLRCRFVVPLDRQPIAMAYEVREAARRAQIPFLDDRPEFTCAAADCDQRFSLLLARSLRV